MMFHSRQFLLPLILLSALMPGKAQSDASPVKTNNKLIVSLSGGMVIPDGEFSYYKKDNYTSNPNIAGPASNGYNGKLELTYLLFKNFGLNCMIYSSVNKASTPGYNELFPPTRTALGSGSNMTSYTYSTTTWYTHGALLGPVIGITEGKLRVEFKLSCGVQQVQSPATQLDKTGHNWNMSWPSPSSRPYNSSTIQPKLISYNFVADAGIHFSYNLIKKLNIMISLDYLKSRASFKGHSGYTYDSNDGTTYTHTEETRPLNFTPTISLLCLNAGFSYAIK